MFSIKYVISPQILFSVKYVTSPQMLLSIKWSNSGYFYSTLEKFEKADKYFEMALKINSDDTVACVNRARNYLKTNEITKIHPLIRRLKEVSLFFIV